MVGSAPVWTRRAALIAGLCVAGAGLAQDLGVPQVAILVLDRDRLYTSSTFGQRVLADIEAASETLRAENRRIDSELTQEESRLTELRATLPEAEFRTLAEEFNTRVEGIRRAQDAKAEGVTLRAEAAQQRFFEVAGVVLQGLAQDSGAAVILDRRTVIAAASQVDITDLARARIDAQLGDGASLEPPLDPE